MLEIERFAVRAMSDGNYGFSGEAVDALRLGPCRLDRPPAFFANTVEYHRRNQRPRLKQWGLKGLPKTLR